MKMTYKTLLVALALAAAGCTQPATNAVNTNSTTSTGTSTPQESANAIVQAASHGQFHVASTFEGPNGLLGLVIEDAGGGKQIGWSTADGKAFTPGPLFGDGGKNFNQDAMTEHGGLISADKAADKIKEENLGFIASSGKAKADAPIVTVFFEPYCTFCHKLFFDLKSKIEAGDIKMRVILVNFLRPDSAERAADIAHASNPYKALSDWENNLNSDETLKKPYPPSKATEEQKAAIAANSKLMRDMGQNGTPAIVFCNKDTKKIEAENGYPQDIPVFLAKIGSEGHNICK